MAAAKLGGMTNDDIPASVLTAVRAYRGAICFAVTAHHQRCEAARRGDEKAMAEVEKGQEERSLRLDRARTELDEAVRRWA